MLLRSFNEDSLLLFAYINGANQVPYLMLRSKHEGQEWFSLRGVHELTIQRSQNAVQLRRWSQSEKRAKSWAALYFMTWEGMTTFLA